jgi:outer membrane lipoprotein-sorting protein
MRKGWLRGWLALTALALLFSGVSLAQNGGDSGGPDPGEAAEGEEKGEDEGRGKEEGKKGKGEAEEEADGTEEKLDPETKKVLDLLDETHRKIRSFKAPYKQVRKVRICRRLKKAEGALYIQKGKGEKGMKVLFVETKPFRSRLLFTETEVVFQDGETGEVKRRDPGEAGVRPSEIWVLGRPVAEITRHYDVKTVPLEEKEREKYMAKLELEPRSAKLRKWVRRIWVWARKKDALGVKIRIVDRTGDYQEFTFDEKKLELNPELEDALFRIP